MIETSPHAHASVPLPLAPEKTESRLKTLDFLRGMAVLGVVAVHTSQAFPIKIKLFDLLCKAGGFGVQLFFFISAFTMCYMWQARDGEKSPVVKFYIRRFLRIAPLFWAVVPLYLYLYGNQHSMWAPNGIAGTQVFLTLAFLHGFWPDAINSVVPGGWSIAVEMTFYVVFPFIIMRFKKNAIAYLHTAIALYFLYNVLIRPGLASFFEAYFGVNSLIVDNFLYLNFLHQAPIFLLGCYLFLSLHTDNLKRDWQIYAGWVVVAGLLNIFFQVPGFQFLCTYLALALVVYIFIQRQISFPIFEALGRKSYSIYLFHFFVLGFLARWMPLRSGIFAFAIAYALVLVITYLLSIASEKLFERHFADLARRLTRR